ncbi:glucan endo-1,6-beta-glucosidase [Agromyces intestinalis]|uniref:Glucan endo-1,6-beta-glucosidase n=1 Tax=Agromyces intestinalis TaxID=2592652 RepID=A0A5C1YJH4_9MICO|nr:discoidin domain-containing protein [Agromyces intestinalis]QEO14962.1 glucan endo-1,6-beta-glucosidase [Agromyces intestinalis]
MRFRTKTITVATVIALATSGALAAGAAPATATDQPPEVRSWLTTVDRARLLEEQPPLQFTDTPSTAPTIVIDPELGYQEMDGFGASITDSSAHVLYNLSKAERDATMRKLFHPVDGIGISLLRQPIGSSDFTATSAHYTYDDVAPGKNDYLQRKFTIAHDEAQILPLLRQAKQLNPKLKIVASPWSPPAWMKTNDSLVGGKLEPGVLNATAYAAYLVRYVVEYKKAGVPIDFLTIQNEPQNRTPDAYPGMDMPVADQARVIRILGPLLKVASPKTKILGYDHNWATHPNDLANVPPGQDPEPDYPAKLLLTKAAKWIAGTAFHCYYGDPSAQTALHERFPDRGIWFTECSGSHGADDPPAKFFRDTLVWHARTITIGVPRNWSKTTANWNLALDETGGPHLGGCGTCTGLVTTHSDGTVTTNAEYYTIGHLSKFVQPGAVRIASTSFGTTGWNGQVTDVAFRNPDGSFVLVAHNENDDPRAVAVSVGSKTFETTLPGGALATYTWAASAAFDDGLVPVSVEGATASATSSAGSDAEARFAVDADASTRWSSGQAQAPGQALTIDLGVARSFSRVAIDSGGNLGDYARGWELSVSSDGSSWTSLASGAGVGQLTNVDVAPTTARYLRIASTASAGNWWSLADMRLYG